MKIKKWWLNTFVYPKYAKNIKAFYEAIQNDDIGLITYFLENVLLTKHELYRALDISAKQNKFNVVKQLLTHGAEPDNQLISNVTEVRIVKQLILHFEQFDINKNNFFNIYGERFDLCNLLHIAVKKNDISFAKFLLSQHANINAKDNHGNTPIHFVSDIKMLDFLLEKGANINTYNGLGENLLHIAVEADNIELVKKLLNLGMDINAKTLNDNILYSIADEIPHDFLVTFGISHYIDNIFNPCIFSHKGLISLHLVKSYKMAKLLVNNGAQINAKNASGYTPLHCVYKHLEIIKLLLDNGADIKAKTNLGYSIIHIAVQNDNLNLVKLLLNLGLDVNMKAKNGQIPLHFVKSVEMAKLLIKNKADVNVKDCNNCNPLYYMSNYDVIDLLLSYGSSVVLRDKDFYDLHYHVADKATAELLIHHGVKPKYVHVQNEEDDDFEIPSKPVSTFKHYVKIGHVW